MKNVQQVSIVLPCLNEKDSILKSVLRISEVLTEHNISGEIIIVDNNSDDGSTEIIKKLSDRHENIVYVHEPQIGYGSAYRAGFDKALYEHIIMLDCDLTYDFKALPKFVEDLKTHDFVIGDRFRGEIKKGAMPKLHRYIGNPVLSGVVRLFFGTSVKDTHCGMRAVTKSSLNKMNLRTTGMEFASEMVIKAVKNNLSISEIPTNYFYRKGNSKLKSFRDGWRHLRFILLYSPIVVFLIPGIFIFLVGLITMTLIYFDNFIILGRQFVIHPIFISSMAMITGFQLISFAGFAKAYAVTHLQEDSHFLDKIMNYLTIEKAIMIGALLFLLGIIMSIYIFNIWINNNYGNLDQIKNSVVSMTLIILGIQVISNSFMTSILGIKES